MLNKARATAASGARRSSVKHQAELQRFVNHAEERIGGGRARRQDGAAAGEARGA